MTKIFARAAFAVAAIAMVGTLTVSDDAEARGGKEYYSQTYQFDQPMDGYEGFSGAYHCSYVRTPKKVCKNGKCKKIWELLQTCQ